MLEKPVTGSTIGEIRLAPHQISGVERVRAALEEFGGALLCDAVGAGKTYVGAAVAARAANPLIVAPAALREMWREAAARAGLGLDFVSAESLSRRDPIARAADFLIVDEAHHFRNPSTLRHRRLARLAAGCRMLLMTATPIHNARKDLVALAALFLGKRAERLTEGELVRLVIRRDRSQVSISVPVPEMGITTWLKIPDRPNIVDAILSLPPPVPMRDGGEAAELIGRGLIRQWASSDAALRSALKRRLARAAAMGSSLEGGAYPSERELRTWIAGEEDVQLGFAQLLSPPGGIACAELLTSIRSHGAALGRLLEMLGSHNVMDSERAMRLREIRARHPLARIVAFSSYSATVRMLFDRLAPDGGVAALTASAGRVAGGKITRREILEQFSPGSAGRNVRRADRINLLVATDLLSEGVNLQEAEVAVHLDLPWTPARLEQRAGRVARMGSRHRSVTIYGFSPPESAERILRNLPLLATKWRTAVEALGNAAPLGFGLGSGADDSEAANSAPALNEKLRELIERWRLTDNGGSVMSGASAPSASSTATEHEWSGLAPAASAVPMVAAVRSDRSGFIALVRSCGRIQLTCDSGRGVTNDLSALVQCCELAKGERVVATDGVAAEALQAIRTWLARQAASAAAGLGPTAFLESRRRILDRIGAIAAKTPPQARPRMLSLIAAAREIAMRMHGSAVESELKLLAAEADFVSDRTWLERVLKLGENRSAGSTTGEAPDRILAILLLLPG